MNEHCTCWPIARTFLGGRGGANGDAYLKNCNQIINAFRMTGHASAEDTRHVCVWGGGGGGGSEHAHQEEI